MSVCEKLNLLFHLLLVSTSAGFIPTDMSGVSSALGSQDYTVHWVKIWQNGQAQSVIVNAVQYTWELVTGVAPKGSVLGTVLFSIQRDCEVVKSFGLLHEVCSTRSCI